jgi:hypothetical protein
VPVLPEAVPGAAVSPGARICNFAKALALTVIEGLVLAALLGSVASEAVNVLVPALRSVTLKVLEPEIREEFAGKAALVSDDVIATVSTALFTRFQFASTARTAIVNAVPAVCTAAVPVFPATLPGAAVSPGASSCSFEKAPALTVIEGLVFAANVPTTSLAVTVLVPAVLKVRLDKVRVPATKVTLPAVAPLSSAIAPLASEHVMFTLGVAVPTMFQLASTAFTMMLLDIAVPAV